MDELQILHRLNAIGAEMAAGQPPRIVFDAIVEAVQALGFDRVRLDLVTADGTSVSRMASRGHGKDETEEPLPVNADPDLMALFANPCPQVTGLGGCEQEDAATGEQGIIPLVLRGKIIGKLTVDNLSSGRPISRSELDRVVPFAHQAVIAHAMLRAGSLGTLQNDEEKLQRLERLAQSTRELMGNLDGMSLQDRLMLIARYSAEILQAETAGVFRAHDGEIVLEASYGQAGEFEPGKIRLRIHDEPRGGLTGYIAYHGKLFTAKGKELKSHIAITGTSAHAPSGDCYSLLAIPLKRRTAEGETLIGLIRVDNKKSKDGKAPATLGFSTEDESILSIFAEAAEVAIESAELVDRLKERKDFQERLIASSPDGIISVDRKGWVTEFNKRAEGILGYSREEVIGKPVFSLYFDPEEPRRLGQMLRESYGGYVWGYETAVRSREGERIPILHSSTWLFNSRGERIGSVGFLQDLRQREALERRESFLLWASNAVARASTLDEGLQSLAERLVLLLGRSFCGILLLDEDQNALTLRAASQGGDPAWTSSRQQIVLSEWPGLEKLLEAGEPSVRERREDWDRSNLEKLSRLLALPGEIHSLLVVPLKIGEQVVGVLDLGNLQGSAHTGFSREDIELVSAIASQITVLIHRMQLLEIRERREELLRALVQASLHIRADIELPALQQVIVRLAAELVRCEVGGIFLNLPYLEQLELVEVFNAPEELKGQHFSHVDGLIGQVAREREIRVHPDPMSEELFRALGLQVVVAAPLRDASGEVEAVLFLGDSAERGPFGRDDLGILEAFAAGRHCPAYRPPHGSGTTLF
ncbi:MAG: hypothetical protein QOF89_4960 [Acidobacteriota bacterium]|jgi:PAS domain S-box-containing protein|nr:hypothetical protein [Acidobacteriota bacterium]